MENSMNQMFSGRLYIFTALLLLSSCKPINYFTHVQEKLSLNYSDKATKFKTNRVPWVVYSNRSQNPAYKNAKGKIKINDFDYLDAFLVVGERGEYFKLIEYEPEVFENNKLNYKKATYCGWVHKSTLFFKTEDIPEPDLTTYPYRQPTSTSGYWLTFEIHDGLPLYKECILDSEGVNDLFIKNKLVINDSSEVKDDYDYDFDYPNKYFLCKSNEYCPDEDISIEPSIEPSMEHNDYGGCGVYFMKMREKKKPVITGYVSKGNYTNGFKNGKWETLYKNTCVKTEFYCMGLRKGLYQVSDTSGLLIYQTDLKEEGEGTVKGYYPDGTLKYSQLYINGKKNGVYCGYYNSGIVKSTGSYLNGLKDGEWTYYDSGGKLRSH